MLIIFKHKHHKKSLKVTSEQTSWARVMCRRGDLGLTVQSFRPKFECRNRGKPFSWALRRLFSFAYTHTQTHTQGLGEGWSEKKKKICELAQGVTY